MTKTRKSETIEVPSLTEAERDATVAGMLVDGVTGNANLACAYGDQTFGDVSLTEAVNRVNEHKEKIRSGNVEDMEALLIAQASALNAIFVRTAGQARRNLGQYLDATDRYLRLALKAQNQCRSTLQTLADLRRPRVTVGQANIAQTQQVNNEAKTEVEKPQRPLLAAVDNPIDTMLSDIMKTPERVAR